MAAPNRPLRQEVAALAAAFLLAAGAAEAYLRTFAPQQLMSPAYDDRFGMRGFKADARIKHQTADYSVSYTTNNLGFRGKSYLFDKPAGTYRIVALGSSFIFGTGVEDADVFSEQLELRLRAWGGPRFDVINLGMMGISLSFNEYLYREVGRRYRPDLVVLHMFFHDRGGLTYQDARRWETVPVSRTSGLKARLRRLVRSLPGYVFLCENSHLYGLRRLALVDAIDRKPAEPRDADAARKFDDLQRTFLSTFGDLSREACADGAHMLVVAHRGNLDAFPLIQRELRRESPCRSLREIDIRPEHTFPQDYHWTPPGHAFVAARLEDFVRERIRTAGR